MLRCWWGIGEALVAVRDDGGSRCAITLLGWRHYQGMRAVAGVGRRAWRCRRRAAVIMESTMTTRTVDNATKGEGRMTRTSGKRCLWKMQGDGHCGEDDGGEHWTVR